MTDIHCHACLCVVPSSDCAASTEATCACVGTLPCGLKILCFENSTPRSHDRYATFMAAELVYFPQGLNSSEATPAMAMAVQQQQMQNQGDLAVMAAAMTPGGAVGPMGTGGGEHKMSGQTPCAKRPVNQSTIAVAAGGNSPMSMEDLVGGFHNLANLRERDEKWSVDIAKTVEWNATLLNALVSRVNIIDASVSRQSDSINVLNDGVKAALTQAAAATDGKEFILRGELSAMAENPGIRSGYRFPSCQKRN